MIYKPFHDLQLSQLGMGNMRLPTIGERGPIDEEKAREIIEYVYDHGVNYFDTAYRYHDGESERVVGKVLSQYPRESWHLATKMPGHMMRFGNGRLEYWGYLAGHTYTSPAEFFEEQLVKCGVDYFDFYLLHNLGETSIGVYTNEELGIVDYLLEQKKAEGSGIWDFPPTEGLIPSSASYRGGIASTSRRFSSTTWTGRYRTQSESTRFSPSAESR
jgi:uncharacterized protein